MLERSLFLTFDGNWSTLRSCFWFFDRLAVPNAKQYSDQFEGRFISHQIQKLHFSGIERFESLFHPIKYQYLIQETFNVEKPLLLYNVKTFNVLSKKPLMKNCAVPFHQTMCPASELLFQWV